MPKAGWLSVAGAVELLAGNVSGAAQIFREGYAIVEDGAHERLRAQFASMLAFLLAGEGDPDGARPYARVCERADAIDPESFARLRAAQALVTGEDSLAEEAVGVADESDDLNLQAGMRLTLGRVRNDGDEIARAVRLFERKGNVAAASAAGLWSLQP
jgi:hypothetical protein